MAISTLPMIGQKRIPHRVAMLGFWLRKFQDQAPYPGVMSKTDQLNTIIC